MNLNRRGIQSYMIYDNVEGSKIFILELKFLFILLQLEKQKDNVSKGEFEDIKHNLEVCIATK